MITFDLSKTLVIFGVSMEEVIKSMSEWLGVNPWFAPMIAMFVGVLTSLMPCSLSTIPLIIGCVGGSETISDVGKVTKKALKLSLFFALGSAIVFCLLGMIASVVGGLLEGAEVILHLILSLILVLMALQMWNVINIIPSDSSVLSKISSKGWIGALIAGIVAGVFTSHCALPMVVTIMAVAADTSTTGGLTSGPVLLLAFSVGHAFLSVIAGTSVGFVQRLVSNPKYDKFSKLIRIVLGCIIMITAIYLLYSGLSEGIKEHLH